MILHAGATLRERPRRQRAGWLYAWVPLHAAERMGRWRRVTSCRMASRHPRCQAHEVPHAFFAGHQSPRVYTSNMSNEAIENLGTLDRAEKSRRLSVIRLAQVLADVLNGKAHLWEHSTALVDYLAEIDTAGDIPSETYQRISVSAYPAVPHADR